MILPLVTAPDRRLNVATLRVVGIEDGLASFVHDMVQTMKKYKGVGLAANQVGAEKSIAVVDDSIISYCNEYSNTAPITCDLEDYSALVLLNPHLITKSEELEATSEGCLSFPGAQLVINRPASISVEYMDMRGTTHMMHVSHGLLAVCLQHEIDHLSGITFVDHVSRLKQQFVMRKVAKSKKKHGIL